MGLLDRFRRTDEERNAIRQQREIQRSVQIQAQARVRSKHAADATGRAIGKVLRDEYMTRDEEVEALRLDAAGLPTGVLRRERNRLVIFTRGGMVNPKSTYTHQVGIYSFTVRGTGHHAQAAKTGDFKPGAIIRLEREPDNPYDPNAVAIYAERGRKPAGYVNKLNAKRLAKLMDQGDDIVAISTRGGGPGNDEYVPQILACERRIMEHLCRNL